MFHALHAKFTLRYRHCKSDKWQRLRGSRKFASSNVFTKFAMRKVALTCTPSDRKHHVRWEARTVSARGQRGLCVFLRTSSILRYIHIQPKHAAFFDRLNTISVWNSPLYFSGCFVLRAMSARNVGTEVAMVVHGIGCLAMPNVLRDASTPSKNCFTESSISPIKFLSKKLDGFSLASGSQFDSHAVGL